MTHHQRFFFIIWVLSLFTTTISFGQTIEEMEKELAALEAELDSISIFAFIDSLVEAAEPNSSILLSAGYANQVLTNGQDLGIEQFGINTSANYYHKSGVFGSYSGFYNSETTPGYYLNIVGLGYIGTLGKSFTYNAGYEKSFFGGDSGTGLTNSLNASVSWNKKQFTASLSYAFLFDGESAHQVIPSLSYNIKVEKVGFIKSINILPTVSIFYANSNIITANFDEDFLKQVWLLEQFNINGESRLLQAIRTIGFGGIGQLNSAVSVEKNTLFNNLNQSITIPVNLQLTDRLSLAVTYSYLISNDLVLGTVVRDEQRLAAFVTNFEDRFTRNSAQRFVDNLDRSIVFENSDNTNFLSISLSYFLQFQN